MYTLLIKLDDKVKKINFNSSSNLADILLENNIYLDRACSGKGTCGKCKVKFLSNAPAPNSFDISLLTQNEIKDGYRLSCKCLIDSDASIEILPKNTIAIQEYGISEKNNIYIESKEQKNGFGLAIDLGTTTIVVYLVNLKNGNIIGVKSVINPQRAYGDNVITRCEYINSNADGLETLRTIAIDKINELIKSLTEKYNIDSGKISRVVLSGNTIMQHIIMGVNPFQITIAPYTPVFTEQKIVSAHELGLEINPTGRCYITNSVSGYIGGDIVSGIIAVGMDMLESTSILIDIGTNGEMVLSHKDKMYSCSVAAGPAFEGEHIKYGVGGIVGAINKAYSVNGKLKHETIGDATAIGICGSGLLDIVAFLLDEKILNEMGSLDETKCQRSDGEIVYNITENIFVSQRDIREIQLAKSAIAAGTQVLIQKAGITFEDIDTVFLAGGFGSYLNINSAAKIGLLDKELESKCKSAGNTAGMGSVKSLLSDKVLQSLDGLVDKIEYVELSFDKSFNDLFIDNMIF